MITFSTFMPSFGNKNPSIKYFIHFENGKKKELKHFEANLYYYCIDRKKHFVKVTGSLYHKNFEEI